jgi:hypothetical protein
MPVLDRRCSRCQSPVRTDAQRAGQKIGCPKCGKQYVVTRVRKQTLICPRCTKRLEAPEEPSSDIRFRCPGCQVFFRIKPARTTQLARDLPVLDIPPETNAATQEPAATVLQPDDAPYYGEAILIDTQAQQRVLRAIWIAVAGLAAVLGVAATLYWIWQRPSATVTIRGTVYFGDKPVGAGLISLVPAQGKPIDAAISDGGAYEANNVPFGELRIAIVVYPEELRELPKMTTKEKRQFFINWGLRPVTILPAKYANPEATPLRYTVAHARVVHDIRLEEEALPPAVKHVPYVED